MSKQIVVYLTDDKNGPVAVYKFDDEDHEKAYDILREMHWRICTERREGSELFG